MKRTVIAFTLGAALATAGTAYGEEAISTMIGKKVQIEYDVVVNGKKLDVKAIAIDGKSYAPIRAFSESVDYDLAFTDKTVILNDPALEGSEPMETATETPIEMSPEDKETIEKSEIQIANLQKKNDDNKLRISELDKKISETKETTEIEYWQNQKETAQSSIDMNQSAITQLQAYIAKIKAKYEQPQQ